MPADGISIQPESTGPAVATYTKVVGGETRHFPYAILATEGDTTYRGFAATFRIVGRAATTQNLMSIYNASATTVVRVNRMMIDTYTTATKALAIPPSIVRVSRVTAAPASGAALPKVPMDTALTSSGSVTLLQDASADGTNAGTALAATIPAGNILTQEVLPRNAFGSGTTPAAGVWTELADRIEFFSGEPDILLRQNQGLVMHVVAPAATSNPNTDFYTCVVNWDEFTP